MTTLNIWKPVMDGRTANGKPCWIPGPELAKLIRNQAKGSWQQDVVENLINHGYIIGYEATGSQLKGKARSYQSKYQRSLRNLMTRIDEHLVGSLEILDDQVGPKGAFGYRLVI